MRFTREGSTTQTLVPDVIGGMLISRPKADMLSPSYLSQPLSVLLLKGELPMMVNLYFGAGGSYEAEELKYL